MTRTQHAHSEHLAGCFVIDDAIVWQFNMNPGWQWCSTLSIGLRVKCTLQENCCTILHMHRTGYNLETLDTQISKPTAWVSSKSMYAEVASAKNYTNITTTKCQYIFSFILNIISKSLSLQIHLKIVFVKCFARKGCLFKWDLWSKQKMYK